MFIIVADLDLGRCGSLGVLINLSCRFRARKLAIFVHQTLKYLLVGGNEVTEEGDCSGGETCVSLFVGEPFLCVLVSLCGGLYFLAMPVIRMRMINHSEEDRIFIMEVKI